MQHAGREFARALKDNSAEGQQHRWYLDQVATLWATMPASAQPIAPIVVLPEIARPAGEQIRSVGRCIAAHGTTRRPSPTGSRRCASASGWSMPSAPSLDPKRCSPICRAIPIGSGSRDFLPWALSNDRPPGVASAGHRSPRGGHRTTLNRSRPRTWSVDGSMEAVQSDSVTTWYARGGSST